MELHLSKTVESMYEKSNFDIDYFLWEVNQASHELDPDIPTEDFYVTIRKSRYADYYAGHAHPDKTFVDLRRGNYIVCPNGRITMSIGTHINEENICRLFSHELRHLGQAARRKKEKGFLTFSGLRGRDLEPDCRAFQERIVTKMGY